MSAARSSRQKNDLLADDRFNAGRHVRAGLPFYVPPDLDKVERGLRRQNVATLHSGWAFRLARYASNWSSGIPSPRSSCSMPRRILVFMAFRFFRSQRSCSSWVSRSRSNASSALAAPVACICFWILASRLVSWISICIATLFSQRRGHLGSCHELQLPSGASKTVFGGMDWAPNPTASETESAEPLRR